MADHLGSHVKRRAKGQIQFLTWFELRGKAEIGDADLEVVRVLVAEQYVFWLQVPVTDTLHKHRQPLHTYPRE